MPEYCVTGGTGLIAAYLIKSLLEQGHIVRATVRDPENVEKIGYLLEMKGAHDRLKLMKANLTEEGSFDEAIDGVDGVFHTASPVIFTPDDNIQETLVDPTIKGTMNVLSSCNKSKSVKRLWYAYAKTIAEKDAWNVAKESGIDLVVVNPSFVVGPLLAPQPTSSLQTVLSIVTGAQRKYTDSTMGFVHIDDAVAAHILAMEVKEAQGRLICSSIEYQWSKVIQMLKSKYPFYAYVDDREEDDTPHSLDTSKILQLGLPPFKSLEQMFDDCIKSFQNKGFM